MDEQIRILIKGVNYEDIIKSVFEILNVDLNEDIRREIENNRNDIIIQFIEKVDDGNNIINTSTQASKRWNQKPSLLWENNRTKYGGVAGVIEGTLNYPINGEEITFSIRLQIKTRFDNKTVYFLATLLLRDEIKVNNINVDSDEEELYDYLLLYWYKTKLREAYEKGFYKTYRRFEDNNDRLKGAIDISKHIRLNAGQSNGKIAYSYRENTVNNFLNHLIVVAYEYIKNKYPELVEQSIDNDTDLKRIIDAIKCEIGYEPLESNFLIKRNNRPIAHPYYMEYEDLRIICIKILRDEGISIWDAENEQTKSILFYVPDLWELFLEDKLKEEERITGDIFSQGTTPDGDTEIRVYGRSDAKENRDFSLTTYPDFVFYDMNSEDKSPYCILDAKFRKGLGDSMSRKNGTAKTELYDYTKCIRDMNSINVHATGVIFPVNEISNKENLSHRISKYNDQDVFYTFPVTVPKEMDEDEERIITYNEWKKDFDSELKIAIKHIADIVVKEREYASKVREYMKDFPKRE